MTSQIMIHERSDLVPPPAPALLRSIALAIVAHTLLLVVLTNGINWKKDDANAIVQAELWSSIPVEAAPPAVTDAPPEPPKQVPPPEPVKQVAPKPAPPPPAPPKAPDISTEKDRTAKLKQQELQRLKEEKLKKEKDKLKEEQDAKQLEAMRQQNIKKFNEAVGSTGLQNSTGTASKSSGNSANAGYGDKVRARVRPNITFTDTDSGNPRAEVEVSCTPDGTILKSKLTKSSGVPSWDEAVLRGLDKTETLPRDTDGKAQCPMVISFTPH